MPISIIQPSFAAGELSPNLFARVDMAKYKIGAAFLRNFFPDFRGGASNRMGTQYTTGVNLSQPGQPRLIPFIVSQASSYALIFGNHYIWVIQNGALLMSGGSPYSVATPYAVADLPLVKLSQSADVMTLTHPSYPPATLTLNPANNTFAYAVINPGPQMAAPTALAATATTSSTYAYGYVVCAVSLNGKETSLPCAPSIVFTQILDETKAIINNLNWTAPGAPASLYKIYKWGPLDNRQGSPATLWGYIGSSQTTQFTDNNIAPDFTNEPPQFGDPFSPGQFEAISVSGAGGGYTPFSYVPLTITGGGGSGAQGFAVVNYNGTVSGVFLTNAGKNYTGTPTVTAGGGGATFTFTISSSTPLYPAASNYLQQRTTYGGASTQPQTINLSQTGNYNNFNTTPVPLATDAISVDIASTQANAIKAFQNVAYGMITFTSGGTFLVNGGAAGAAITPTSISAQAQASNGANDMPPLQINYSILYVQNKGNIVRDLSFAWQRQSYTGSDISTFSNHLFYNQVLTEWAWCEEPYKLVWVVRADGVLLSLSYVPDQEIYGWAHHDTNGWFRSVCSVPEGDYNVTYVLVQRLIGGVLTYMVERMDSRVFTYLEDSWFLDCALALPNHTNGTSSLLLSAASGNGVTATVSGGSYVFPSNCAGSTLWAPGVPSPSPDALPLYGKATVTQYLSPTQVIVNVTQPFALTPNSNPLAPAPLFPGTWALNPNVTVVSGLPFADGTLVTALADGQVVQNLVVHSGAVTLPNPASKVLVGLGYQSQLKTLRLDTGEPTTQGKRKMIPAVTLLLDKSKGLKVGGTFDQMDEIPLSPMPYNPPGAMTSGEQFLVIPGTWNPEAQICFQQDAPLPCTILGIVPNVVVGDNAR